MTRLRLLLLIGLLAVAGCWSQQPEPHVPPSPIPTPGPAPAPVKAAALNIITIDDANKRTQAQGLLLGDLKYWNSVRARGHSVWMVDSENAAAYQSQIQQAGGLPCIILSDKATAKQLAAVRLPADEAGVDALIQQYSGK